MYYKVVKEKLTFDEAIEAFEDNKIIQYKNYADFIHKLLGKDKIKADLRNVKNSICFILKGFIIVLNIHNFLRIKI